MLLNHECASEQGVDHRAVINDLIVGVITNINYWATTSRCP